MRLERVLTTIDAHAGGEPLRIVTHGIPLLDGNSISDRLDSMRTKYDQIRLQLMQEPRGHIGMRGAVLLSPADPKAHYGVFFMTTSGYLPLSGNGIMALTTALIETGAFPVDGPEVRITYETLVGNIQARASIDQQRVFAVRYRGAPSFRLVKGLEVFAEGMTLEVDVAFGGGWFAIIPAAALGVEVELASRFELSRLGVAISRAVSNELDIVHPLDDRISGLQGTVITGAPHDEDHSGRSAVIYPDGSIDRSPSGTATAALIACRAADGELSVGETYVHEGVINTTFSGSIVHEVEVGDHYGIIPEIVGRGAVTGMHQFFIDSTDPLFSGFLPR